MWMLSFIPDSVLQTLIFMILFVGAAGYILGSFGNLFLGIKPYSSLIKTISTILMVGGVYFYGGYGVEMEWRNKAKELQAEIDRKDAVSAEVTEKIVTQYVDKVKIVKEKGNVIIKEIPKYITKESDANCVIPNSFIVLHNSASRNEIPDTSRTVDDTASTIKLSTVIETVSGNYTIYYETAEQLKALQDWVRQQEKIYNGK
jgi:hypothetical protein